MQVASVIQGLLLVRKLGLDAEDQTLGRKRILSDRFLSHGEFVASHGLLLLLKEGTGFFWGHLQEVAKIHQLGELEVCVL